MIMPLSSDTPSKIAVITIQDIFEAQILQYYGSRTTIYFISKKRITNPIHEWKRRSLYNAHAFITRLIEMSIDDVLLHISGTLIYSLFLSFRFSSCSTLKLWDYTAPVVLTNCNGNETGGFRYKTTAARSLALQMRSCSPTCSSPPCKKHKLLTRMLPILLTLRI